MSMKSHGFRSNFELTVAQQLVKNKIKYEYEKHPIEYIKECVYTPDFYLEKYGFFIEVKGQFTAPDRGKHLLIINYTRVPKQLMGDGVIGMKLNGVINICQRSG